MTAATAHININTYAGLQAPTNRSNTSYMLFSERSSIEVDSSCARTDSILFPTPSPRAAVDGEELDTVGRECPEAVGGEEPGTVGGGGAVGAGSPP